MKKAFEEVFGYERLEVWQTAVDFAGTIYDVTQSFPQEEVFGLTSQMRRAAVSGAANIAEGASRASRKDQVRFFEIAYGSLCEIATMLVIASRQGFVSVDAAGRLRSDIARMCRMLSGLRRAAQGEGK